MSTMTAPSIRTRVVVIGGGILGVSTATQLVRSGAQVSPPSNRRNPDTSARAARVR